MLLGAASLPRRFPVAIPTRSVTQLLNFHLVDRRRGEFVRIAFTALRSAENCLGDCLPAISGSTPGFLAFGVRRQGVDRLVVRLAKALQVTGIEVLVVIFFHTESPVRERTQRLLYLARRGYVVAMAWTTATSPQSAGERD
jgi:hypothetical protein